MKVRRLRLLWPIEEEYVVPCDWRQRAIRAAWAIRDWHTLKACGEIDEIPEP